METSRPQDACPQCGSRRIVMGELTYRVMIGLAGKFSFRAFASRFSFMRVGAKLNPNMAACAHCGLVWGQVSVDSLMRHLETIPTADVKHWLRGEHDTPL